MVRLMTHMAMLTRILWCITFVCLDLLLVTRFDATIMAPELSMHMGLVLTSGKCLPTGKHMRMKEYIMNKMNDRIAWQERDSGTCRVNIHTWWISTWPHVRISICLKWWNRLSPAFYTGGCKVYTRYTLPCDRWQFKVSWCIVNINDIDRVADTDRYILNWYKHVTLRLLYRWMYTQWYRWMIHSSPDAWWSIHSLCDCRV